MKVRKFQAPTMDEALKMVKCEFGNDAVILKTKKIQKSDSFGIFGRDWVEIEAAIDNQDTYERGSYNNLNKSKNFIKMTPYIENVSEFSNELESIKKLLENYISERNEINRELPQLKKMLSTIMKHSGIYPIDSLDSKLISLYEDMVMQEVNESIAYKLIENIAFEIGNISNINSERLKNILKIKMRSKIKTYEPPTNQGDKTPKIISFIGPTGVGKTTTLAKIAAKYRLIEKKKTALFTFDTYRIAAVEQLKTYAEILKTPVVVVNENKDFKDKLNSFSDYNYILVDTAGRSQRDTFHIQKIKDYFNFPMEINLVLSATTKNRDLDDIISRFSVVPFTTLLFTKLDESSTYGNIFNKAFETEKPLSYFGIGQKVPEDLEIASKDKLINYLLDYS